MIVSIAKGTISIIYIMIKFIWWIIDIPITIIRVAVAYFPIKQDWNSDGVTYYTLLKENLIYTFKSAMKP